MGTSSETTQEATTETKTETTVAEVVELDALAEEETAGAKLRNAETSVTGGTGEADSGAGVIREVVPSELPPAYTLPPPDAGLAEVVEPDAMVEDNPAGDAGDAKALRRAQGEGEGEGAGAGEKTTEQPARVGEQKPTGEGLGSERDSGVKLPSIGMITAWVEQNEWKKVCEALGGPGHQSKLPAAMALVYAVALNEMRVPGGVIDRQATNIEGLTQASVGAILGAKTDSNLVRILSRRILKRAWAHTPAPPRRTSVLLVIAAVALGAFAGFLLEFGRDWFTGM